MKRAILVFTLAFFGHAAEVNLALIRFQPNNKKLLLESAQTIVGNAADLRAMQATLEKKGTSEVIFEAHAHISDGQTNKFATNQTARVVMPGQTEDLPPITRLAVQFDVSVNQTAVSWTGSVRWSPQIIDASGMGAVIRRQSGTNVTFIRPFAPNGRAAGFEYPVLKETFFQSSKILRKGEVAISSTTVETGGSAPEMLALCLWLTSRE